MKSKSTPKRFPAADTYLRIPAAADFIAVSPRSLANASWRRKLGIPTIKIGRAVVFDTAELRRWVARHRERQQAKIAYVSFHRGASKEGTVERGGYGVSGRFHPG
jgi:predicted DNA-binding transcriptional regulator AlpA